MSLLIFIAILVALIWVHELGHFSVAKLFGIRVDEFAIGFPPRLLTVQWGETRYSFNLLLIGGYVSIYGENPGEGDDPRSLTHKNRAIQALVLFAGIFFNIAFAWLLLAGGYMAGLPTSEGSNTFGAVEGVVPTVVALIPDSPAMKAGLMQGDVVQTAETATTQLSADATAVEVQSFITAHPEETILLHVLRDGEAHTIAARPAEGIVEGRKALGVQLSDVGTLALPFHLALGEAAVVASNLTVATVHGLGSLIAGAVTGSANLNDVAGPIGIASVGTEAVQTGVTATLFITVLISINLAIVNLLPIPGLDGGRLFILLIESVIRRPVAPQWVTRFTLAGFAFILVVFVLVSVNDITRLVG